MAAPFTPTDLAGRDGSDFRRIAHPTVGDDSADATGLLALGAPLACPTCGSFTEQAANGSGWRCQDRHCVWGR